MPFILAEKYVVGRKFKLNGVEQAVGTELTPQDVIGIRDLDALTSRKFLIPDPDPHARRTDPETKTPVSHPGTLRRQVETAVEPATDYTNTPGGVVDKQPGDTVVITATAVPAGADPDCVWTTTAPNVVTVARTGPGTALATIVGLGSGSVRSEVKGDPSAYGYTNFTVYPLAMDVVPAAHSMEVGQTFQLDVAYTPSGKGEYGPAFTSSNPAVATVGQFDGLVTAVAAGTATIDVKPQGYGVAFEGTDCVITVTAPVPPTVTLDQTNVSHPAGVGDFLLTATVAPPEATQQVTWDDPSGSSVLTPDAMGPKTCGVAINAGVSAPFSVYARSVDDPSASAECVVTPTAMADDQAAPAPAKRAPRRGRK